MSRRKRIGRLIEVRERELNQELAELGRARHEEKSAEHAVEAARSARKSALAKREGLASAERQGRDWVDQDDWVAHLDLRLDVALAELARVVAETTRVHQRVTAAYKAVQQLESLAQRLAQEERTAAERSEQKQSDEFASRMVTGGRA